MTVPCFLMFNVYIWVAHLSGTALAVSCFLNNVSHGLLTKLSHRTHASHSLHLSVFQLWILALTALRPHLSVVTPTPRVKAVPSAVS